MIYVIHVHFSIESIVSQEPVGYLLTKENIELLTVILYIYCRYTYCICIELFILSLRPSFWGKNGHSFSDEGFLANSIEQPYRNILYRNQISIYIIE